MEKQREVFSEEKWEKRLGISTLGREDYQEDRVHYPYEPTPYVVLERILEEGLVGKEDVLVDLGCGKGRVPLFFASQAGCRALGVECDGKLFEKARENLSLSGLSSLVSFLHASAEDFPVPAEASVFFFFNPFGEVILRRVLDGILDSYYENPRPISLLFYYPDPDQVALLMGREELFFQDEVDTSDLFPSHPERERVLLFSYGEELF